MSFEACAALVERGDPERWRAAMAAPEPGRGGLMALYAFNLEIARAGYVVSEPMMGEIRLRWWADAIGEIYAGGPVRRHEVAAPLAETIRAGGLPREPLDAMIEARSWDCGREPFADQAELEAYLEATGAGIMWLAARWLGAPEGAEGTARGYGFAAGAAGFLRAIPGLYASGRAPLPVAGLDRNAVAEGRTPPGLADAIRTAAEAGLRRLRRARGARRAVPREALPALLPAATAGAALRRAAARPDDVLRGGLEPAEVRVRGAVLLAALTGRV